MNVTKNIKISKQEQAYNLIKQLIIRNEFSPGMILSEQELCDRFGFSRTPVREALRRLAGNGFVDYIKDKGSFVKAVGMDDLLQQYEVREALEGLAARLCAMRATKNDVLKLENFLTETIQNFQVRNYVKAMEADMNFHYYIIKVSRNPCLENIMDNILDQISRVAFVAKDPQIISQSIEDHQEILNAIKESDADLAEKMARIHIAHSKKYNFETYYGLI